MRYRHNLSILRIVLTRHSIIYSQIPEALDYDKLETRYPGNKSQKKLQVKSI